MAIQITQNARRQHETRDDAERAVEIFYPAGYFYSVVPMTRSIPVATTFTVKVYDGSDCRFLGYAYDPEETALAGAI